MAKIDVSEWADFESSVEVNEAPTVIGSMLFRLFETAGYTPKEIATVARTLNSYAD